MFPEKTMKWGKSRNCIRELFEYGLRRKAEIGAENVYDFSLGNPSIPTPECIKESMIRLLNEENPLALHGYTSAPGRPTLRKAIAEGLNARYGTNLEAGDVFVTCGAAAGLAAFLRGGVHRGKVRGDLGVGIKAVDDVEVFDHFGGLYGQVGGGAAAKDHHVDLILPLGSFVHV